MPIPQGQRYRSNKKNEVGFGMKARTSVWMASIILVSSCLTATVIVAQTSPPTPSSQTPATPAATPTPPQNPGAPPNPESGNPDDQKYKLAVDVELVNVVATVLDENQKYMDG